MQFYKTIHKYYDFIFPLNIQQVYFVKNEVSTDNEKKILDIGCATGSLAIELGKTGYIVDAIDLDENMIYSAKQKQKNSNVRFKVANMLKLHEDFSPDSFNGISCFGNTMVHLTSKQLIVDFLESAYRILKKEGKLMLQILNYEYILKAQVTELPIIDNENITFKRYYQYLENGLINFKTTLVTKYNNAVVQNEVLLYPITKSKLLTLIEESGFKNIRSFHNFNKSSKDTGKLPLIVVADK